jgi:hypothetical protein
MRAHGFCFRMDFYYIKIYADFCVLTHTDIVHTYVRVYIHTYVCTYTHMCITVMLHGGCATLRKLVSVDDHLPRNHVVRADVNITNLTSRCAVCSLGWQVRSRTFPVLSILFVIVSTFVSLGDAQIDFCVFSEKSTCSILLDIHW